MYRVELASRARKDLKALDRPDRDRIVQALRENLESDPIPANADVKMLSGAAPWLRLRVGTFRVLYREAPDDDAVRLVGRIVHRRDLERAVHTLD